MDHRTLAAALELCPDAIVFLDSQLRVTGGNEALERLSGCPRSQLVGRPLAAVDAFANAGLESAGAELEATGRFVAEHICEQTVERPRRLVTIELRRLDRRPGAGAEDGETEPEEVAAVGLLRDVTELRRLESLGQAINLSDNLGQLFSGIRHELGNPINSVKTAVSVLRRNLDSFPRERTLDYFDRIGRELTRVEELLKSLRSLSAFEQPALELINVGGFLERLRLLTHSDFARRSVELSFDPEAADELVLADPRALLQVAFNLLNNALDATADRERAQVEISVRRREDAIVFRIRDNGIGFHPDDAPKLLEPFYTSKTQGTGLGLAICQKLISSMGGRLEIEGQPDAGCTATVHLAVAAGAEPR